MFKLSEYRRSYISDIGSNLKKVPLKPYERLQMDMSATVQSKSRTYPHFRDLENNQIEELPPEVFHNNSQLVIL